MVEVEATRGSTEVIEEVKEELEDTPPLSDIDDEYLNDDDEEQGSLNADTSDKPSVTRKRTFAELQQGQQNPDQDESTPSKRRKIGSVVGRSATESKVEDVEDGEQGPSLIRSLSVSDCR